MSRIQNILEKAEREGTALRTSRVGATTAPATPLTATVPIPIDIPTPSADVPAPVTALTLDTVHAGATEAPLPQTPIVPAAAAVMAATPAATVLGDDIEQVAARLNPVLVAGLAPQSLAAEQYRALRTRLSHAEGAGALRTVLITSPQKGEGKSVTSANLAL